MEEEVQKSLCDSLLFVVVASVTVVLATIIVVDKAEEVIVLCAVEDCRDVEEVVSKLVCASVERIASKPRVPRSTERRMKSVLT